MSSKNKATKAIGTGLIASTKGGMAFMRKGLTAVFLFTAISVPEMSRAAVVSPFELPADIQACMADASCAINSTSIMDYNNASMFEYFDIANNTTGKLIRYDLNNAYQIQGDVLTGFNGPIWLQVADQYDLSNQRYDFTLYIDQVSPEPTRVTTTGSVNLSLTKADLLSGSGYISNYLNYPSSGSLFTDTLPPICLAEGCSTRALFNLVYLQYVPDGTTATLLSYLNTQDNRSVLYSQGSSYDAGDPFSSYFSEQVFTVQAVPVPAAVWLFASGLLGLVGLARSKKT